MKIHVARTLKFWVDAEYEFRGIQSPQCKRELVAQILLEWEASGDAMRYLDHSGRIGWKATSKMLDRLRDAELDANEEFESQYL